MLFAALILTIQAVIIGLFFIVIAYLIVRRIKIKKTEKFEKRDN